MAASGKTRGQKCMFQLQQLVTISCEFPFNTFFFFFLQFQDFLQTSCFKQSWPLCKPQLHSRKSEVTVMFIISSNNLPASSISIQLNLGLLFYWAQTISLTSVCISYKSWKGQGKQQALKLFKNSGVKGPSSLEHCSGLSLGIPHHEPAKLLF